MHTIYLYLPDCRRILLAAECWWWYGRDAIFDSTVYACRKRQYKNVRRFSSAETCYWHGLIWMCQTTAIAADQWSESSTSLTLPKILLIGSFISQSLRRENYARIIHSMQIKTLVCSTESQFRYIIIIIISLQPDYGQIRANWWFYYEHYLNIWFAWIFPRTYCSHCIVIMKVDLSKSNWRQWKFPSLPEPELSTNIIMIMNDRMKYRALMWLRFTAWFNVHGPWLQPIALASVRHLNDKFKIDWVQWHKAYS